MFYLLTYGRPVKPYGRPAKPKKLYCIGIIGSSKDIVLDEDWLIYSTVEHTTFQCR